MDPIQATTTLPNSHATLSNGAVAEEVPPALAPALEVVSQKFAVFNERALVFIREQPIGCMVGAVALGFVVGKIAARY